MTPYRENAKPEEASSASWKCWLGVHTWIEIFHDEDECYYSIKCCTRCGKERRVEYSADW